MAQPPTAVPNDNHSSHPYDALTPDTILDAVELSGRRCTGGLLALNSYENRVYRVDIDDAPPLAAKFYRPGRWSDAAIAEEHAFIARLADADIPVVAPEAWAGGTVHAHQGFRFALFPWQPGRSAELARTDQWEMLGRYLGRMHLAGGTLHFRDRPVLSVAERGHDAVAFLMDKGFIPPYLHDAYSSITRELLNAITAAFAHTGEYRAIALHGDCHLSNLLWTEHGAHFVDFDDCCMGPAVQDLWMLLTGTPAEMSLQFSDLMHGYTEFMEFDARELHLVEALRALRMLHYSAWLARRWDDPAFPRNFPWFNTQRYWEEQVLTLREQLALLQEPPLMWDEATSFNR